MESDTDPSDARSRRLRLSAAGKKLVRRLEPLWETLNRTSIELDEEAGRIVAALDRLDEALIRLSLYDRVQRNLAVASPTVEQPKKRKAAAAPKKSPRREA